VREYEVESVRYLLTHAADHVPYYAALPISRAALEADPVAAFAELPLLSRQQVREAGVRLLATSGDRSRWRRVRTTGTTGSAIEIVHDDRAQAREAIVLSASLDQWLGGTAWRHRHLFHLTLHPEALSTAMPAGWNEAVNVVRWNLARLWAQDDQTFCERIAQITGSVITTMPSVATLLAERLADAPKFRPSVMVLSGETVTPPTRQRIASAFGCPARSFYTMAEFGIVGVEHDDEDGYTVNGGTVLVEIIGDDGRPVTAGVEGEIIITTLVNFAMPLIRYRTGDRGCWVDRNFQHFRLMQGRPHRYLSTDSGGTIGLVRFAKLLAILDLDRCEIDQSDNGAVRVSYESGEAPLDPARHHLIEAVLRGALGPRARIEIVRGPRDPAAHPTPEALSPDFHHAEPIAPPIEALREWLRESLTSVEGIVAAALFGSAVDARNNSRFSDIDLSLFVAGDPWSGRWFDMARQLRGRIPRLVVHVDTLPDFEVRAPLVACRLLSENVPVIGSLAGHLPWPDVTDIRRAGVHWAQSTLTMLWLQASSAAGVADNQPLRLWLYFKICLDALRYRYLSKGERATATHDVYSAAMRDESLPPAWRSGFSRVRLRALELEPPDRDPESIVEEARLLAKDALRTTQAQLLVQPARNSECRCGATGSAFRRAKRQSRDARS
jgi:phenylacetate-coenzyme A ligase PaaK-like adenylate-forming protein